MVWQARIKGEITTSSKALPFLMDLMGQEPDHHTEGLCELPAMGDTITITLDDTYDTLASHFAEAIYNLAQSHPEQTAGRFTITGVKGFHVAQEYRVEHGRMFRRSLTEAPEQEVFLHTFPAPKGRVRDILVSNHDLEGIRSLRNHERRNHAQARRHRPA